MGLQQLHPQQEQVRLRLFPGQLLLLLVTALAGQSLLVQSMVQQRMVQQQQHSKLGWWTFMPTAVQHQQTQGQQQQ
jgi:hypothetical protein